MTFSAEVLPGLPDVLLITPRVFPDERGVFLETWRADAFRDIGIDAEFVQDNHSLSRGGVLRGLHYQVPPHTQGKLVRAAAGEVFDVVVDLRRSSPSFGVWAGRVLSAAAQEMIWIPEGFAHGFLTVSDEAIVVYKATAVYAADSERTLRWDDPDVAIEWPEVEGGPTLSPKDADGSSLAAADVFP